MADTDYPASWYAATRDASPDRAAACGHGSRPMSRSWAAASPACTRRGCWRCAGARSCWSSAGASAGAPPGRNGGFVGAGFAARSGALIDRLGLDHARRLYAQSQRGVAIVRDGPRRTGPARYLHGQRQAHASRAPIRAQASPIARARSPAKLGASFEPWETDARARADRHRALPPGDPRSAVVSHPSAQPRAGARAPISNDAAARCTNAATRAGLERQGAVWRLRTAGGEIAARHVVLAGNADLGRVQPRIARAVLPVATYVAVTAKLGPQARRGHPLARRDLRHAPRRRLLSHRRRRPPAVGRPHHHRHARAARLRAHDARRHPLGLSRSSATSRSNMPGPASWAMRRT